jgi:hypothetical protein
MMFMMKIIQIFKVQPMSDHEHVHSTEMAVPHYSADDGPLTSEQITQIQNSAPKAQGGNITSSLFSHL